MSVTNYGQFLDQNQPEFEVEIINCPDGEGSSWSCAHGVGRWQRNCGCQTGGEAGWNQSWREPLRSALDVLRDNLARQFEDAGRELLRDPWHARNLYVDLILDRNRSQAEFFSRHERRPLSLPARERALTLLEIQRNALLMDTSCGWFFSEISGIETVQILRYAARSIDLAEDLGLPSPRARFLEMLAEAPSNVRELGNGANVFQRFADIGARELSQA